MSVSCQPHRGCGSHASAKTQNKVNARAAAQTFIKSSDNGQTIYIPVILNMCDKTYDTSNITEDVAHTITTLNNDFNNQCQRPSSDIYTNPEFKCMYTDYTSRAGSANVHFYIEKVNVHPLDSFDTDDIPTLNKLVKGVVPPVSPQSKLNLWVVSISSGLLGYAQFPWDLAKKPSTDGVVIASGTFGKNPAMANYNLGKSLSHEAGHWCSLWHCHTPYTQTPSGQQGIIDFVPGDNPDEVTGDQICDTPQELEAVYGNPFMTPSEWPHIIVNGKKVYSMFFNFMDYVDDAAMFMFTKDQCTRMRLLINVYRPELLKNGPPGTVPSAPTPVPQKPLPATPTPQKQDPATVSPPAPTQPKPKPLKAVANISYSFDLPTPPPFSMSGNATVSSGGRLSTKCLRLTKASKGSVIADLSGAKSRCIISFYHNTRNPNTYFGAGSATVLLPVTQTYKLCTFLLPREYTSDYVLSWFTLGGNSNESLIDDITVTIQ